MIVLPLRIRFKDWIGSLAVSLPSLIVPTPPRDEKDWREWAETFIGLNALNCVYPLKNNFPKDTDWRKWGLTLIQSLDS